MEDDVEIGNVSPPEASTGTMQDELVEAYLKLDEISKLHAASNIDRAAIERSDGFSSDEAARRLEVYGKNAFTPPPRTPEWKRFLQQFQNIFLILLIISGLLSIVAFLVLGDTTNLYLAIGAVA